MTLGQLVTSLYKNFFAGIVFESKVHDKNLNPEFKFSCEIPVVVSGDYEVLILPIKVDEPRGQSVEVTVWDYDPLRLDQW